MNTPRSRPTRVSILGGGPSGLMLALLLQEKGVEVEVFHGGKRPPLIVGESVVPAVIPLLRRLGIEDEIAAISQRKPGVTFVMKPESPVELSFQAVQGILPTYAYNVPRPGFEAVLEKLARKRCVCLRDEEGRLQATADGQGVKLLQAADLQPDLIVDATGRRRMIAKLLQIPSQHGPRRDTAYFAHFENWQHPGPPGQVIIAKHAQGGWTWQIPLPKAVSVGAVLPNPIWQTLGNTPTERLEHFIASDALLSRASAQATRVSEVPVYSNYQLTSERGYGPGWALCGDAFGFVDPMLSPGLWVALHSAEMLAEAIPAHAGTPVSLAKYEQEFHQLLHAWRLLINKFYDGSMMAAYHAGAKLKQTIPGSISQFLDNHVRRQFAGMACGAYTRRGYSQMLLRILTKHTWSFQPKDFAVLE